MKFDETFDLLATNYHFSFFPSFVPDVKVRFWVRDSLKVDEVFKIFLPSKSNVVTSEPIIKPVILHVHTILRYT